MPDGSGVVARLDAALFWHLRSKDSAEMKICPSLTEFFTEARFISDHFLSGDQQWGTGIKIRPLGALMINGYPRTVP